MQQYISARTRVGRLPMLLWALVLTGLLSVACDSSANRPPETETASPVPSQVRATVPSRPEIGFASEQRLKDHYQKHGREFGSISMQEYLRQAQVLRDKPAGGDILEATRSDGVISRFDRSTGAFIAFNRDGVIRTFFRPNDGEAYFWRQSRRKN